MRRIYNEPQLRKKKQEIMALYNKRMVIMKIKIKEDSIRKKWSTILQKSVWFFQKFVFDCEFGHTHSNLPDLVHKNLSMFCRVFPNGNAKSLHQVVPSFHSAQNPFRIITFNQFSGMESSARESRNIMSKLICT